MIEYVAKRETYKFLMLSVRNIGAIR